MSVEQQKKIRIVPLLRGLLALFFLAQAVGQADHRTVPDPPVRPRSTSAQKFTFREDFTSNTYKSYAENADWNIWNHSVQLSLTNGVFHHQPLMAVDPSGNTFLTWFDYRMGLSNIYAQKLDPSGNRLWQSDLLIQAKPFYSRMDLVADKDGNAYVFWAQRQTESDSSKVDILAQKISPTGAILFPAGGKVFLSDFSPKYSETSLLPRFISRNGLFYATWFGSETNLYLRKMDGNGNPLWNTDVLVHQSSYAHSYFYRPAMDVDLSGRALVAWRECRVTAICENGYSTYNYATDTFAGLITQSGDRSWPAPIHVANALSMGDIGAAFDNAGNAAITWADYSEAGVHSAASNGIYAQKLDTNGAQVWAARGLPVTPRGYNGDPQIVFHPDGYFGIAWHGQGSSYSYIFLQLVNADGSLRFSQEMTVNLDTGYRARDFASIGLDPQNNFRIAWLDKNVFVQKISSLGEHLWMADSKGNEVMGSSNQSQPTVAADQSGGAFVLWVDDRNVNSNLFLQRTDAAGNRLWDADILVNNDWGLKTNIRPSLSVDATGNATVVWFRDDPGGVMIQRFDGSGNRLWKNNVLAVQRGIFQLRVSCDPAGNSYIAFIGTDQINNVPTYRTFVQKMDSAGTKLWPDDLYLDTMVGYISTLLDIQTDSQGNVYLAWRSYQLYDSNGNYVPFSADRDGGLWVQKLNPAGAKLWSDSAGITLRGYSPMTGLRISMDASGVMYAFWTDLLYGYSGGYSNLMGKFDTSGSPIGSTPVSLGSPGSYLSMLQDVVALGPGFLPVYEGDALYVQKIDSGGISTWGSPTKVASTILQNFNSEASALQLPSARALLFWKDGIWAEGGAFSETNLFQQTVDANGSLGLAAGTKFIDPERFYLQSGRAVSAKVNAGTTAVDSAILTTEVDHNGGSATFYLSNDGGATWVEAVPGIKTLFSTVGSDLRWKAELLVDPVWPRSPVVTGVSIEYTTLSSGGSDAYETDDSCAEARPIDVNGAHQQHNFGSSTDEDWEYFDVRAGYSYSVQVTNAQSSADPALALYAGCSAQPLAAFDSAYTRDALITRQAAAGGRWYVRTTNSTPAATAVKTAYHLTVREVEPSPTALVVVGKAAKSSQQTALNATGDLAYKTFMKTGMLKANLRYYRPSTDVDLDGDGLNNDVTGLPTVLAVKGSIQDWAREQGVSLGIPFYLVLVGGGSADRIVLDSGEEVTTGDLGLWLSNLEATSGADNLNVILDAPQSGTFLDVTTGSPSTIAGKNRVVITSTSSGQNSYLASDRSFFSSVLFRHLGQKKSLADAFLGARQAILDSGLSQDPQISVNGAGATVTSARTEALSGGTALLIETPAATRGINGGSRSLPPVVDTAGCGMSGTDCVQVNALIRDDVGVSEAWLEVYRLADVSSGEALVAVTVISLAGKGDSLYGVDGIRIGAGQNIYVMVRDTDGNLGEAYPVAGTNLAAPAVCTISGQVAAGGVGVAGVVLSGLPGSPSTDSGGNYTSTVNAGWSGVVTPVKSAYTFTPVGRTFTNVTSSQTAKNFEATPITYTVSGQVTWNGAGLSGVVMGGLPGSPVTDSGGTYTGTVDAGWSGTVTPSKAGYSFSPASLSYTNVLASQTAKNHTATLNQYTVTGQVTWNGAGLTGVVMGGLPGSPATDSSGIYTGTVDAGWSGTVTPSKAGYSFSPASLSYTNVLASQTGKNHTATLNQYTVTGQVTWNGAGLTGVVMSGLPGSPATDAAGNYAVTVNAGWSGTAVPVKEGYSFNPPSCNYSNVSAVPTPQDYTASPVTFSITGNAGVSGAALSFQDGTQKTATADGSGNYSFTVSYNWSGTVTVSKPGYLFTPAGRSYSNVTSNQTGQNYSCRRATYLPLVFR